MSHIGLIIGRFQPLHKGHCLLIQKSLENNPETLVLVGSSDTLDNENPYSFSLRKRIILDNFSNTSIFLGALPDFPDDTKWKDQIIDHIASGVKKVTLYCGDVNNDSATISLKNLQHTLPFELEIIEIPRSIIKVSATQVRNWIGGSNREELKKYLSTQTLQNLDIEL